MKSVPHEVGFASESELRGAVMKKIEAFGVEDRDRFAARLSLHGSKRDG